MKKKPDAIELAEKKPFKIAKIQHRDDPDNVKKKFGSSDIFFFKSVARGQKGRKKKFIIQICTCVTFTFGEHELEVKFELYGIILLFSSGKKNQKDELHRWQRLRDRKLKTVQPATKKPFRLST